LKLDPFQMLYEQILYNRLLWYDPILEEIIVIQPVLSEIHAVVVVREESPFLAAATQQRPMTTD
jgi:hypothetical protein